MKVRRPQQKHTMEFAEIRQSDRDKDKEDTVYLFFSDDSINLGYMLHCCEALRPRSFKIKVAWFCDLMAHLSDSSFPVVNLAQPPGADLSMSSLGRTSSSDERIVTRSVDAHTCISSIFGNHSKHSDVSEFLLLVNRIFIGRVDFWNMNPPICWPTELICHVNVFWHPI